MKSLLWGIIKKKGKKRKTENEVGGGELQKPFVLSSVHFLSAFFIIVLLLLTFCINGVCCLWYKSYNVYIIIL